MSVSFFSWLLLHKQESLLLTSTLVPVGPRLDPYPFLEVSLPGRLAWYGGCAVFGYYFLVLINRWHPGKPLLGDVPAVKKVVDPKRPEKGF